MPLREARMPLTLAALAMAWLLVQGVAGLGEGVAMLAPALLLAIPLLAGRYLGEDAIDRARAARAVPPVPRPVAADITLSRAARAVVPRGGLLLAASLATRPPPALARL